MQKSTKLIDLETKYREQMLIEIKAYVLDLLSQHRDILKDTVFTSFRCTGGIDTGMDRFVFTYPGRFTTEDPIDQDQLSGLSNHWMRENYELFKCIYQIGLHGRDIELI